MGAPTFWDNNDRAQKHIAKLNGLKKAVLPVVAFSAPDPAGATPGRCNGAVPGDGPPVLRTGDGHAGTGHRAS